LSERQLIAKHDLQLIAKEDPQLIAEGDQERTSKPVDTELNLIPPKT
jgi:hypothetical protein